ncbi:MAG: single-stranded DNA-binding protein [Clostridiales bacterium]|nr:single-stranded DNA-binding protein [Clostridiales bacterium]
MLNVVAIVGRLVADPEQRTTGSGVSVTSFTVAVDRSFVRAGEERQADFIDVVAWRQTADFVCRYFRKGSWIAVNGSLQTRNYEDKNGNKRKATEIVADNVSFCGPKTDTANTAYQGAQSYQHPAEPAVQPVAAFSNADAGSFREIPEDDLPF